MAVHNKQCINRLQKEYKALLKEPVPHITAHPSPSNLLEWHFVLEGAKATDYEGGVYHGKLVFPPQYPFKPPSISLFTPNGRFATNTKLCLSMTDYHPESWNPMWSVGTILNGLLSFMYDNQPTTGSITTTNPEKRKLAAESLAFNVKNPTFRTLFQDWVEVHNNQQQQQQQQQAKEAIKQECEKPEKERKPGTAPHQHPDHSSSYITIALLVVVLALAVVPLLSTKAGVQLWTSRGGSSP